VTRLSFGASHEFRRPLKFDTQWDQGGGLGIREMDGKAIAKVGFIGKSGPNPAFPDEATSTKVCFQR